MHLTIAVLVGFALYALLPFCLLWRYLGPAGGAVAVLFWFLYSLWRPRPWPALRGSALAQWLYDSKVVVHGDFDPSRYPGKSVVAAHPHGLYPVGVTKHFVLNARFARFRTCVHWLLIRLPILKEITGWAGCIDATAAAMDRSLEDKGVDGLVICPGSVREGVLSPPGTVIRRTGFIDIARRHGAYLVPVYDASAAALWDLSLPFGASFQSWLRYPWPVVARGRWSFFPRRRVVHLYIGEPIATTGRSTAVLKAMFYGALGALRENAREDGTLTRDAPWIDG